MKNHFKNYWTQYVALIFLILGLYFYGKAYGDEYYQHPVAVRHINLHLCKALKYDLCTTNHQKYFFHKENAERCFNEAKERCWWLPNITDREKAKYCFLNIGIFGVPGDQKSKMIIALVSTLIQYGIDCSDEWHYINNKLYWSQYHYEMMEFYTTLINEGHT